MKPSTPLTLAAIVALTAALLHAAPPAEAGTGASSPASVSQPVALQGAAVASPQAAVAEAVEAQSSVYSGDCADAVSPQDIGKLCSKFVAQSGALRAYLVGRTFSEFGQWVFIRQSADGWQPYRSIAPHQRRQFPGRRNWRQTRNSIRVEQLRWCVCSGDRPRSILNLGIGESTSRPDPK
jgi:hypothetical protein